MPANPRSLAITDAYRSQLVALRTQTATMATNAWAMVSIDDLERTVRQWAAITGEVVARGQFAAASLTGTYLAAYIASETGRPARPHAVDTASYEGKTEDGRPVADLLAGASIAVRVALSYGRRRDQALSAGLVRGIRGASGQVLAAGRSAMDDLTQADQQIIGWRRVTSSDACGVCLAAATGAIQSDSELLLCHDSCRCCKEPVVRGVAENVGRPTGTQIFDEMSTDEQDALFSGRGGAAKADLIRSGDVALADLIQTVPQASRPDQLVEAPLAALVPAH